MSTKINRYVLLSIFAACSFTIHAQSLSLESQLKAYYEAYKSEEDFDIYSVKPYLDKMSKEEVESYSDSTQYYYHYWMAVFNHENEQYDVEYEHLQKAVSLREKSVGVLDPEYINLLWKMGIIIEDTDVDKAIQYYQKALIIGQTILSYRDDLDYDFSYMLQGYGAVTGDLAKLYEKQGLRDWVVALYKYAFSIRSRFYDINDLDCCIDMINLAVYYANNEESQKVVETMQTVVDFIEDRGGYGTNNFVYTSSLLASALAHNNQHIEAEELYAKTIKLSKDSLGLNNEYLYNLYGNYCVELSYTDSEDKLNMILPEVHYYYSQRDTITTYVNILYTIAENLYNRKIYEKAEEYTDSLLNYVSILPYYTEEVLYSWKTNMELMRDNIESAIQWKQKELEVERKFGISDVYYYLFTYSTLGTLYSYNGQKKESMDIFLEIIDVLENNSMEEDELYERSIFFVSDLLKINQKENMLFLESKKANLYAKGYNKHRIYALVCSNLSFLQTQSGQLKEALENNSIEESIFLLLDGRLSDSYATALHNKGRILMLLGDNESALNYLKESKLIQLEVNKTVNSNTNKYIQEIENK